MKRQGRLAKLCRDLRADTSGNTLAIAGTAVLMLVAAVGGGVDMSRAYMTKTNMQAACDAGVLAGRRALSSSATYGASEKAKADKMFKFNMNAKSTQATAVKFESEAHDDGSVSGTVTATMPTVIMRIFALDEFDLDVDCSAELQMASADVMFVLDVTGSMAGTKITGLRAAVREFHKTVADAVIDKEKTIIRYGFVPYSLTVNAGKLFADGDFEADWFADQHSYQTVVANFNTAHDLHNPNPSTTATTDQKYGSNITLAQCDSYGKNTYPTGSGGSPVSAGTAPSATTVTSYVKKSWTYKSRSSGVDYGECWRTRTVVTTTYTTTRVWKYTNTSSVKATVPMAGAASAGGLTVLDSSKLSTTTPHYVPVKGSYNLKTLANMRGEPWTALPSANVTRPWGGCIEERDTVQNSNMKPIPDAAHDMDINDEPDGTDATKWKLYLPDMISPKPSGDGFACPAQMRLFEEVDTSSTSVPDWLASYLDNDLQPKGYTFHDIGMVWGARLASTHGMFSENVLEGDRKSVSRHIIFMTDGDMNADPSAYSAWGLESKDNRVASAGATLATLDDYHNKRFLAACELAKQEGYTIWVIGFGTTLTADMKTCSSADRAYQANNNAELLNAFRYIAGQVADLRINK